MSESKPVPARGPETGRGGTAACGAAAPQDTDHPLVSVIVPVYNGQDWLGRCLDAIAAQTMPDLECILVDDGSTDGSAALCRDLAARDRRFRLLQKANGGVCSARNAGLAAAKGRYVVFCDQDDLIDPHTLEYALEMQRAAPGGFVVWNMTRRRDTFEQALAAPLAYTVRPLGEMQVLHRGSMIFVHVWNKLFDRQRVEALSLRFDEALGHVSTYGGEDEDFVRRYMAGMAPDTPLAYSTAARYYHARDNLAASITGRALEGSTEVYTLPEPEPGYLAHILNDLTECEQLAPGLWQADPVEMFPFMRQHYRAICYGLWCARQLREPLPKGFWRDQRLQKLLNWCAANRVHIAYWLPLRLRWRRMAERMYVWSQLHDANFGHFDWLFYYIEGARRWKRPDTL